MMKGLKGMVKRWRRCPLAVLENEERQKRCQYVPKFGAKAKIFILKSNL